MLEDVPVGVDGKLQFVVLDWTPDGLTVKTDEHRRCTTKKNLRWVALQAFHVLWLNLALVDISEHAVEIDDAILLGNCFFDFNGDFAGLFLRQRLEIGFANFQSRKPDESLFQRR